ncbi:CinA family protein [Microcella sp.]|uniref:CinA family protein n=1 Tax=Microcella sp. TaxID=1913979 RepID=UPI00391AE1B2
MTNADIDRLASRVSDLAHDRGWRLGCAESLTSGAIASALGRADDSSTWFRGGIVAYSPYAKVALLGVTPGPVVTESCAREMAIGSRRLLGADATVAVTGVGGPEDSEGNPPGTVMIAVDSVRGTDVSTWRFTGEPSEIVAETTREALLALIRVLAA